MRWNARWTSSPSRSSSTRSNCDCAAIQTAISTRTFPIPARQLRECYRQGADAFGWSKRNPAAALDARRQRVGRLGHGDRHLGSAADGSRRPHRADRERPRRGRLRGLRYRHRHLHDHGAGRRRHARPAARQRHGQARRFDAAAGAGRRRLVDRGVSLARHRQDRRRASQRAAAPCQENAEVAARGRKARRHRSRRRQDRQQEGRQRRVDRRRDASWRRRAHRAGRHQTISKSCKAMPATPIRRSSPK